MKTVVLSFIYPGVECYFSQFLKSLSTQADKDFVLYLVNDGMVNPSFFLKNFDLPVKIRNGLGTVAQLRKTGIEWVAGEKFDAVIFADADDYFDENRVSISKDLLSRNDIIFNELILFGDAIPEHIPMLEGRFINGEYIGEDRLFHANCLGLSNTALRNEQLMNLTVDIPDAVIAFDWALFAKVLNIGARALFTNKTRTYYRQHACNTASLFSLSDERILHGVNVKAEHYSALRKLSERYSLYAEKFKRLSSWLYSDEALRSKYCNAVRSNMSQNPLWWEPIRDIEEFNL